jgi:hypothetical protein
MWRIYWYGGASFFLGIALWFMFRDAPSSAERPISPTAAADEPVPVSRKTPLPPLGGPGAGRAARPDPEFAPSGLPRPTQPRPISAKGVSDLQRAKEIRRRVAMKAPLPTQAEMEDPGPAGGAAPEENKPMAPKEAIQEAVRLATPHISKCYEQLLEKKPDAAGKIVVEFTFKAVEGAGKLMNAEIPEDGLNHPFMGMCVLEALAKVEYPEPDGPGEITVRYPFKFAPSADEEEEQ